jgi:amidase
MSGNSSILHLLVKRPRYAIGTIDAMHYLEITELAARIRKRDISPQTATRAQLDRIASLDDGLKSYAFLMEEAALAQAAAAQAEIEADRYRGPLHGVPVAVKDLCWTKGVPTAAGMSLYKDYRPARDATVVRRLKDAGAVLLGKLQLTEGAYSDHHPSITPPKNPWNPADWPGISSSGPGVATAAGLCYGSIASDTGGSIRWPAAANGVTGLKPTWGRVSRYGVFELAPTMDHIGPMARSAADCGVVLQAIAGSDAPDPTALPDAVPDYSATTADVRGLRVGIDAVWNAEDVDTTPQAVVSEAAAVLCSLGATLVDVSFPQIAAASADWFLNCVVEAAVAHAATYPARKQEYGSVLSAVLEAGRSMPATDYHRVLLRRLELRGRVAALFRTIDVLLIPVHPFAPLTLDAIRTLGEQPELIAKLQRYTCPFDMTGNPTITLPGGFTPAGSPIAFQLVAAHLDEATLIRAGAAFQTVTSWHRRHPIP